MILEGDCVEKMRELDEASVDAIVTDPPYGMRFMGKAWDGADIERAARARADAGDDGQGGRMDGRTAPRSRGARDAGTYDLSLTGNQAFQVWCGDWVGEALRVLKPGGHLLAFGGTRTYHRLACAVEDAGFEIRDSLIWLYGSGFPKSLDVSKAIDKAAGAEREVVGASPHSAQRAASSWQAADEPPHGMVGNAEGERTLTAPTTPEAARWQGWGTALKPSHEPIVVARKPLAGTVAANVLEHGTGALNVDGCRVDAGDEQFSPEPGGEPVTTNQVYGKGLGVGQGQHVAGRWPSNVVLSHLPECVEVGVRKVVAGGGNATTGGELPTWQGPGGRSPVTHHDGDRTETIPAYECAPGCPVAALDEQSGERPSSGGAAFTRGGYARQLGDRDTDGAELGYGDAGGASRFYYTAKASRAERNAGLDGFEERDGAAIRPKTRRCNVCGSSAKEPGSNGRYPNCEHNDWEYAENQEARHKGALRNAHPT